MNIGVVGKNLGAVSTEQGRYQLPFREELADDTVRISSLGYQTRLLTLRSLLAQPNIALMPGSVALSDVQVQGRSVFRRALTLGNTTNSLTSNLNLNTRNLGAEIGTVISIKCRPTRVLSANFNVSYNKVGALTFRVNFYRLDARGRPTETKLLTHDVFVTSDVKMGTIAIDLTNERLVVEENFSLALQWITSKDAAGRAGQPARPLNLRVSVNKRKSKNTDGAPVPPPQPQDLAFSLSAGYANNEAVPARHQPGYSGAGLGGCRVAGHAAPHQLLRHGPGLTTARWPKLAAGRSLSAATTPRRWRGEFGTRLVGLIRSDLILRGGESQTRLTRRAKSGTISAQKGFSVMRSVLWGEKIACF